jgi:hypothetical protein
VWYYPPALMAGSTAYKIQTCSKARESKIRTARAHFTPE